MSELHISASPLETFLQTGASLHVAADGQMLFAASGRCPPARALLPGSFDPFHHGHWRLAEVAGTILGAPVAFELSALNVDKPSLTEGELRRRLAPFNWQASVWVTRAARFSDKAVQFPGATFIVGADTALRIVSPRYYDGDARKMAAELAKIRQAGCRFLVACRVDARGQYWRTAELPIPPELADLFDEIPPEQFRWDISSTELRARGD